jgi:hypothetical protein
MSNEGKSENRSHPTRVTVTSSTRFQTADICGLFAEPWERALNVEIWHSTMNVPSHNANRQRVPSAHHDEGDSQ